MVRGFGISVSNICRDAWKSVEGMSSDEAKEKYIETLLGMFDNIGEEVNVSEWLSGPNLDPSIKQNLELLGKVV